eukprot:3152015-Rhodomonas_salina.1
MAHSSQMAHTGVDVATFVCHQDTYQLDEQDAVAAAGGVRLPGRLRAYAVQTRHPARANWPNRATSWVRAHGGAICAANVAVRDREQLLTIDLLLRNEHCTCTAVFLLDSGGARSLYEHAKRFVRQTKNVCARRYNFQPRFLILHLTGSGRLRRKYI